MTHDWTDDARRAWYGGDEDDWVVHVETGYPTADIRDALLRNGAALGLESFELSVLRRNTQPDGS